MKISCLNAINVENEIVPLSDKIKIKLLSIDGDFEINYDLQIDALIHIKLKVTKGDEWAIFETTECFENIVKNKEFKTTIDYMECIEDSVCSVKEFKDFYDEDIAFSLIQFKFSVD